MLKFVYVCFAFLFLTACGVDTSSSNLELKMSLSDTGSGDTTPDDTTPDDGGTDGTDGTDDTNTTVPVDPTMVQDYSIFDIVGAIEDKFACQIGDPNAGYTKNMISDTSNGDSVASFDEEYGIGVSSLFNNNIDIERTTVTVFYYDLIPTRSMDVANLFEDGFRMSIDTAWANNEKPTLYVMTPKDSNNLYGCYRYDLSSIEDNSTVTSTKVYRRRT